MKPLDDGSFACGFFLNLQNVFDTVDYTILLNKLCHYGICGLATKQFESYLTNTKSKIGNKGNTAGKQEKHERKPKKHWEKHAETPREMVGNRKSGKCNTEGITMIIQGIQVPETKQNSKIAKCIYDKHQSSISHKCLSSLTVHGNNFHTYLKKLYKIIGRYLAEISQILYRKQKKLQKYCLRNSVCSFQSKKSPAGWNSLLLKFFLNVTWFDERQNQKHCK